MTQKTDFEKAAETKIPGLGCDFLQFLAHHKKWWLLPIVLLLLGFGALAFLSTTGAGPFIYTLF